MWGPHLGAYQALFSDQELAVGGQAAGAPSAAADGPPLSRLVPFFYQLSTFDSLELLELAQKAAAWLDKPATWPAVRQQLAQLAVAARGDGGSVLAHMLGGAVLPNLHQLQYVAWLQVHETAAALQKVTDAAQMGDQTMSQARRAAPLSHHQAQAVEAARERAVERLVQLEPGSPRSLVLARPRGTPLGIAQHYLRALQLAEAQGQPWWEQRAACSLLQACTTYLGADLPADRALMECALQAVERAQRRATGKQRLPQRWVQGSSDCCCQGIWLARLARLAGVLLGLRTQPPAHNPAAVHTRARHERLPKSSGCCPSPSPAQLGA